MLSPNSLFSSPSRSPHTKFFVQNSRGRWCENELVSPLSYSLFNFLVLALFMPPHFEDDGPKIVFVLCCGFFVLSLRVSTFWLNSFPQKLTRGYFFLTSKAMVPPSISNQCPSNSHWIWCLLSPLLDPYLLSQKQLAFAL